jgi:hypothetical protein
LEIFGQALKNTDEQEINDDTLAENFLGLSEKALLSKWPLIDPQVDTQGMNVSDKCANKPQQIFVH